MAAGATPDTMFLFLISGGGSALLDKPLFDDISIDDLAAFNRLLVTCGADIYEMNALRKHFSAVKGGRLALAAQPGRQATIYVSDVPADKPSTVASGPTMPDESSVAECRAIAARYGMIERLPAAYAARLGSGDLPETPKPGDTRFAGSRYYAVLSNQDGIDALKRLSERRGWQTAIDVSCDDWALPRAADYLLEKLRGLRGQAGGTVCLISGGELSCPVTGSGIGGRNAAFALYCAAKIAGQPLAVMSAGTDGIDGNSPAAGAVAVGDTVARASVLGLDPAESFRQSDSYTFFAELGDEIVTGPTGNNVRDLRMLVAE
jgi:hydroxypyruvate reductase